MTEMNQLRYVENAIREALELRGENVTREQVHAIRDHLTLNLFPDLVDSETFDSIVFSMYSLMIDREAERGKFEKLCPPDFICPLSIR